MASVRNRKWKRNWKRNRNRNSNRLVVVHLSGRSGRGGAVLRRGAGQETETRIRWPGCGDGWRSVTETEKETGKETLGMGGGGLAGWRG